ncbi:MAG: NAD(P)-dependent oxidoreductase, partial [Alphaproteobacteria bacterium]|nr:NAD(P)-dependent oxidoreductase [Alphaproteobacteria bacterium]
MPETVVLIGFGEAGSTFAHAALWGEKARVYDLLSARSRVATLVAAVEGADIILSLVTADQTLIAARDAAQHIAKNALFCDMNSVAPGTKRAAAEAVETAGGRYVDVAVMAPVNPAKLDVPLLVSGPHA